MKGLRVGHYTDHENGTGISVFLFDPSAVGAYLLAGSGPATHELAPLDLDTSTRYLHGIMLSGGSAFGLCAVKGVMDYLAERGVGLKLPHGVVPIVPAAGIYDLAHKNATAPSEKNAYDACLDARENNLATGRIGAGTGATIGKLMSQGKRMTGGIGRAELCFKDVIVEAYAVVNALGDVRNAKGEIIAGACNEKGDFLNGEQFIFSGAGEEFFLERSSNTTLVSVFTNAKFNKSELKRISKMAIAGMARAIYPVFTCYDGDILFSISLGDQIASVMSIGAMASEAVRLAILDAVKDSEMI